MYINFKYSIISFFLICFIVFGLYMIANADTIYVPSNCEDVTYAEYSSGGGDKSIVYIKILCKNTDGTWTAYQKSKVSTSGILGFGRWTIPDKLDILKKEDLQGEIEWE